MHSLRGLMGFFTNQRILIGKTVTKIIGIIVIVFTVVQIQIDLQIIILIIIAIGIPHFCIIVNAHQ